MMKITRNIHCGGAQTNINRLRFEEKISPDDVLKRAGYDVVDKKFMLIMSVLVWLYHNIVYTKNF